MGWGSFAGWLAATPRGTFRSEPSKFCSDCGLTRFGPASSFPPMNRLTCGAVIAALIAVAAACDDPNAIPDANLANEVDTLFLWSLTDGPLTEPTAYSINSRNGVRTWEVGNNFEFAFDETAGGQPVFLPTDVLGLLGTGALKPGLRRPGAGVDFDHMTKAPSNGYIVADTVPIVVGDLFFVRTTVSTCSFLGVPLYGKLEVLELDPLGHTVRVRVLANQNCGYRGLNLGIPKR